jgi:hypothetical protein
MALNKPTTLQSICTFQETSRKLAEAGFPQEGGLFYWWRSRPSMIETWNEWEIIDKSKLDNIYTIGLVYEHYRAFTFSELWELLPNCIEYDDEIYYKRFLPPAIMIYVKGAEPRWLKKYEGDNPQEAAAELALWCRQEGHL